MASARQMFSSENRDLYRRANAGDQDAIDQLRAQGFSEGGTMGFGGAFESAGDVLGVTGDGGLIGDLTGSNARRQAERERAAAESGLTGLYNEERGLLGFDAEGNYDPSRSQLYGYLPGQAPEELGVSDMESVQADPESVRAQQQALQQMQTMSQGRLTRADMARLGQEMRTASEQERGQREAILQNAQERGTGGGGAALASIMQAQQSGANRAADFSANIEGQVQQRALGALEAGARQAGQMRGQGFDEATQRARAQQARMAYNTGARNAFSQGETQAQRSAREQQAGAVHDIYGRRGAAYGAGYNAATDRRNQTADQQTAMERSVAGGVIDYLNPFSSNDDEDRRR